MKGHKTCYSWFSRDVIKILKFKTGRPKEFFTFINSLMFPTILIELAHAIMGNAHCINERLNVLPSYRFSYDLATLYVIDVRFVDVNVLFFIF